MTKILCSGQAGFSKFDTVDLARIKSYETLNLKVAAGSSLTTVFKTLNCLQISYFQGFFDFLLIFPQIAIKEKKRPRKSLFWPILAFFRKQPKIFFAFLAILGHSRNLEKISQKYMALNFAIYGLFLHFTPKIRPFFEFQSHARYNVACIALPTPSR